MHNIGQTIANLRKEKGWTQAQLAEKLNISDKAVSKWESDGGIPSVEFFPLLAEVFGVTCDYLLTGKKSEVITSELEIIVKKGNVDRAVSMHSERDENDKSVLDYAIKYKNIDMAEQIIWASTMEDMRIENGSDFINMILLLVPLGAERTFVKRMWSIKKARDGKGYHFDYSVPDELREVRNPEVFNYTSVIEYLIDNYEALESEQKEYYFGATKDGEFKSWWYAYPQFIITAYKKGKKDLFKELVKIYCEQCKKYNEAKKKWAEERKTRRVYNGFKYTDEIVPHNLPTANIGIFEPFLAEIYEKDVETREIIISMFENGYGEWSYVPGKTLEFIRGVYRKHGRAEGDRLSAIFWQDIGEDEVRCLLIEGDESKSKSEKIEEKCVYNGILWLEKAFELCDQTTLKKYLNKYHLTLVEKYEKEVLGYDYKSLYRVAVDMGLDALANQCIEAACRKERDSFKVKEVPECTYRNKIVIYDNLLTGYDGSSDKVLVQVLNSNRERLLEYCREKNSLEYCKDNDVDIARILNDRYSYRYREYERAVSAVPVFLDRARNNEWRKDYVDRTYADLKSFLKEFKARTLQKLTATEEAKNVKADNGIFKELTEEYFNQECQNGNFDFVIIRLCARVEAYFRVVSGYEGSLHEMMNKYCEEVCGNNSNTASKLNRLRIARNAAAHFEGGEKRIQPNEIPGYIKFVMELTEENNG